MGQTFLSAFCALNHWAVTNNEALPEALRATDGSRIGVMDLYGNIVRPSRHQPREATADGDGHSVHKTRQQTA